MKRPAAVASVQIDNAQVIVTEWRFAAGAQTGWHRHRLPYVVVPQCSGKLLLETAQGCTSSSLTRGLAYFRPAGVEHNVINANAGEFVFVEIELKQPAALSA